MIEQIPTATFVVSSARGRRIDTAVGTLEIHHMEPELIQGFSGDPRSGYWAGPEKALFDLAYLLAPRGGRAYFPELTLPEDFDAQLLVDWLERVGHLRLRTLVRRNLDQTLRYVRA